MPRPIYEICWVPIEGNPQDRSSTPSTKFAEQAGLVTLQDQFFDVVGFDDDLLAFVPQPVKAVILLLPVLDQVDPKRDEEDVRIAKEGQHPIDDTVIWIQQTIDNACGTMAMLHALLNSRVTISPESPLANLIDDCRSKTGYERAKILEKNEDIANIHKAAAQDGQSAAPALGVEVDFHYTCFVQAPSPPTREEGIEVAPGAMRLIELDGVRAGPLDRGVSTDLLKDAVRVICEGYMQHTTNLGFTMLALAATPSPFDSECG